MDEMQALVEQAKAEGKWLVHKEFGFVLIPEDYQSSKSEPEMWELVKPEKYISDLEESIEHGFDNLRFYKSKLGIFEEHSPKCPFRRFKEVKKEVWKSRRRCIHEGEGWIIDGYDDCYQEQCMAFYDGKCLKLHAMGHNDEKCCDVDIDICGDNSNGD